VMFMDEMMEKVLYIRDAFIEMEKLMGEGKIPKFYALRKGQEPSAVGVCNAMKPEDKMIVHHASYEWFLALGGSKEEMLEHATGKKGDGKSLSLPEKGLVGASSYVGQVFGIANGLAYSKKIKGEKGVVFCVSGDGSTLEGVFYESLNVASVLSLPVVFVIIENKYVVHAKMEEYTRCRLHLLSNAFLVPCIIADGFDVHDVSPKAMLCREMAESNQFPVMLILDCYRFSGHSGSGCDVGEGERSYDEWKTYKTREIATWKRFGVEIDEVY